MSKMHQILDYSEEFVYYIDCNRLMRNNTVLREYTVEITGISLDQNRICVALKDQILIYENYQMNNFQQLSFDYEILSMQLKNDLLHVFTKDRTYHCFRLPFMSDTSNPEFRIVCDDDSQAFAIDAIVSECYHDIQIVKYNTTGCRNFTIQNGSTLKRNYYRGIDSYMLSYDYNQKNLILFSEDHQMSLYRADNTERTCHYNFSLEVMKLNDTEQNVQIKFVRFVDEKLFIVVTTDNEAFLCQIMNNDKEIKIIKKSINKNKYKIIDVCFQGCSYLASRTKYRAWRWVNLQENDIRKYKRSTRLLRRKNDLIVRVERMENGNIKLFLKSAAWYRFFQKWEKDCNSHTWNNNGYQLFGTSKDYPMKNSLWRREVLYKLYDQNKHNYTILRAHDIGKGLTIELFADRVLEDDLMRWINELILITKEMFK